MDDHRTAIRSIMIASNVLDGIYTRAAKKVRMKENTLTFLYALDDGREHSQVEISREWMIPKTTLNTIVKECIQNGLVTLVSGSHTKEKQIRLTKEGQNYARKTLNTIYEQEERAFIRTLQEFSPEFTEALTRFCNCLNQEMSSDLEDELSKEEKNQTETVA